MTLTEKRQAAIDVYVTTFKSSPSLRYGEHQAEKAALALVGKACGLLLDLVSEEAPPGTFDRGRGPWDHFLKAAITEILTRGSVVT